MPAAKHFLLLGALVCAPATLPGQGGQPEHRLVIASNVNLRARPSPTEATVATLPLGSEVTVSSTEPAGSGWLRVSAGSADGYVLANLTRPFQRDTRVAAIEQLARERLARTGDGVHAHIELFDLAGRLMESRSDSETRGRFALLWLQSLRSLARSFHRTRAATLEPSRTWLASHPGLLEYNEIGANWLILDSVTARIHDDNRASTSADEIAWLAREMGMRGECEGSLPCAFAAADFMDGRYLRRHPRGAHAETAVSRIKDLIDYAIKVASPPTSSLFFAIGDCPSVHPAAESLRAAIGATAVPLRDSVLTELDRFQRLCPPRSVVEDYAVSRNWWSGPEIQMAGSRVRAEHNSAHGKAGAG